MAAIMIPPIHTNGPTNTAENVAIHTLTKFLEARHTFLQPTLDHQRIAIDAAKAIIDPLARQISQVQTDRRNENRKKRKRGVDEVEDPVLQLKQIYTNGLGVKQIWEQAKRILDAACDEVERDVDLYVPALSQPHLASVDDSLNEEDDDLDNFEDGIDLEEAEDEESDDDDDDEEMNDGTADIIDEDIEDDSDVRSSSTADADHRIKSDLNDDLDTGPRATFVQDPNNLNDGFFSIDDFNKQSQFLEQIDARGDDDNLSEEEEIDWDADPLQQALPSSMSKAGRDSQAGKQSREEEEESDEDDEDGPTFGNADLNAPFSDDEDGNMLDDDDDDDAALEEDDLQGMPSLSNTNDIQYADFFEPPPQRLSKTKRTRALPKTQPPPQINGVDNENTAGDEEKDLERAMADVRRDLLDSEDEQDMEEEEEDDISDSGSDMLPKLPSTARNNKNLSTHEKQKLQIAQEIRRLEALNVSKKPWTLSGEASAQARPINSLIEEDLDFERTGKPVPVVTIETTNDIEALVKRRILARDFDEITRRLPDALGDAASTRRGRADIAVDDAKDARGLGEIYEQEYQRAADPAAYKDERSKAVKKQHEEIDRLWNDIREQLDVLGNLHFRPKRAQVEIKVVEDKPRIAMEDARPGVTADGGADGSMLAPQEIYKPGVDSREKSKEEVLAGKSGVSIAREEMSREEKTRRRRREKEKMKKAQGNREVRKIGADGKKRKESRKEEKEGVVRDLQRGGVKVIGKGGELKTVGNDRKKRGEDSGKTEGSSSSALKL